MNNKLLLLLTLIFTINLLFATTYTFTGGGDGVTWEDAANWDQNSLPGENDDAFIGGNFQVTLHQFTFLQSINLSGNAQLTIDAAAYISIIKDEGTGPAVLTEDDAHFINNGTMIIRRLPTPLNGFWSQFERSGMQLRQRSNMTNNGNIYMAQISSIGIRPLSSGVFINNGFISMENTQRGISNWVTGGSPVGTVINEGSMTIQTSGDAIDFYTGMMVINRGEMTINKNGGLGIDGGGSNEIFENEGTLSLNNCGITMRFSGRVFNRASGVVEMHATNSARISCAAGGRVVNEGLFNFTSAANNMMGAGFNSRIANSGTFNISSVNPNATLIGSGPGLVINNACGVMNLLTNNKVSTSAGLGRITNNGVFATVYDGIHALNGSFVNNGEIIAPNGFNSAPNVPTGTGTINTSGVVPAQSACGGGNNDGSIGCTGGTGYDSNTDTYIQTAESCYSTTPFNADEISYYFEELCGNGSITAQLIAFDGNGWAGVAMRESLEAGSKKFQLFGNQGQNKRMEIRTATNGNANPIQFPVFNKEWLRIVRNGSLFQAYASSDGNNWQFIGTSSIIMDDCILIGLASVNSTPNGSTTTATFVNVEFSSSSTTSITSTPPNPTPTISNSTAINSEWSIFPNPTTGNFWVSWEKEITNIESISILNTLGQPIQQIMLEEANHRKIPIQLDQYPPGMYFVKMQKNNGQIEVKQLLLNR